MFVAAGAVQSTKTAASARAIIGAGDIIITSKKKFSKLEKEYRDCIKRKWRQDWEMNETF